MLLSYHVSIPMKTNEIATCWRWFSWLFQSTKPANHSSKSQSLMELPAVAVLEKFFMFPSFRPLKIDDVAHSFFFCIIILDKWLRGAKQDSLIFKPHALRFYKLLKHPGTLATASCFEYMVTVCLHIRRPFVSRAQNSTSPNSELWEVV